jgi:hypothetical protein
VRSGVGPAPRSAEAATRIATIIAIAVLNAMILGVVARHNAAKAEVEASYREPAEYDKFVSARGTLPFAVASALLPPPVDPRGMIASPRLDVSRSRTALDRLLADPLSRIWQLDQLM